ncbi:MAG: rod shape-determining protein MreC [Chitinophagaceae bacterium]|nr:MAG: rod shape-determining protein MreC [Chitinophagaceae bacterium]
MRNIFLFIRRYFTFISFLALQALALSMLFRYNKYHRAVFLGKANEITGYVNSKYDNVDDYFHLKEENLRVHHMNDSLMNLLRSNYMAVDTGIRIVTDSAKYDTSGTVLRYLWRDAKVVNNSVREQKNYIQINRGAKQGIKDNMAVINSDGSAVGVVMNVSDNFSQIMSLLHVQSRVNAMMKKSRNSGTIEWDGKNPLYLTLRGIPKSDSIAVGDTVLTSIYSFNFPPGLMLGTVAEKVEDKSTNFHVLNIKTAANFQNLQQVFVIENLQREEQMQLDKDTRKKIEEINKKKQ